MPALTAAAMIVPAAPPLAAAPPAEAPIERHVLVLDFDPVLGKDGDRLHEWAGWNDPRDLVDACIEAIARVSGGTVRYVVAEWRHVDDFPVKIDGFRYRVEDYLTHWSTGTGWHAPDTADYPALIETHGVAPRVRDGEIDELWMMGGPYFGFWEASMAGPGAYFINGGTYPSVDSGRPFPIMGFNTERELAQMLHSFGHRIENHLKRAFGNSWTPENPRHAWDFFTTNLGQHPDRTTFGAGNVHFPPNGTSDYDYGSARVVASYAHLFRDHPLVDLHDETRLAEESTPLNANAWRTREGGYEEWWLDQLPKNSGTDLDGRANNWWKYVADFDAYSAGDGLPADAATLDADGDGLRDAWEVLPFGALASTDGSTDADGDGRTDRDEFHAATSPTDPASRFAIVAVAWQRDESPVVTWTAAPLVSGFPEVSVDGAHWFRAGPVVTIAPGESETVSPVSLAIPGGGVARLVRIACLGRP